ncbi:MAG: hypothetical protein KDD54_05765, partial [Flavobacteriales bacterium]|nr:hypothetical protein [Flavobacteriales bacterium]
MKQLKLTGKQLNDYLKYVAYRRNVIKKNIQDLKDELEELDEIWEQVKDDPNSSPLSTDDDPTFVRGDYEKEWKLDDKIDFYFNATNKVGSYTQIMSFIIAHEPGIDAVKLKSSVSARLSARKGKGELNSVINNHKQYYGPPSFFDQK